MNSTHTIQHSFTEAEAKCLEQRITNRESVGEKRLVFLEKKDNSL